MRRLMRRTFRGELAGERVPEVFVGFAVLFASLRRREELSSCTAEIVAGED